MVKNSIRSLHLCERMLFLLLFKIAAEIFRRALHVKKLIGSAEMLNRKISVIAVIYGFFNDILNADISAARLSGIHYPARKIGFSV